MIQLRLTVDAMLEEAKLRMSEFAAELDSRPRFLPGQAWLIDATEQLKRLVSIPLRGVDSEGHGEQTSEDESYPPEVDPEALHRAARVWRARGDI
jgi:hypothetical protein